MQQFYAQQGYQKPYQQNLHHEDLVYPKDPKSQQIKILMNQNKLLTQKLQQYDKITGKLIPYVIKSVHKINLQLDKLVENNVILPEYSLYDKFDVQNVFPDQAILINIQSIKELQTEMALLGLLSGNYFQNMGNGEQGETITLYRKVLIEQENVIQKQEEKIKELQKKLDNSSVQQQIDEYKFRLKIKEDLERADKIRQQAQDTYEATLARQALRTVKETQTINCDKECGDDQLINGNNQQQLIKTYISEFDIVGPQLLKDIIQEQLNKDEDV